MIDLARAGLIVLIVWLVVFFALSGLGRWLNPRLESVDTFWLGLGIGLLFFQIGHFFTPLNLTLAAVMVVIGLAGWLRPPYVRPPWKTLLIVLPLVFALAAFATIGLRSIPQYGYDTGLYELQNVIWNNTYSIVPGLANLHERFGFNSSFLLLAAPLDQLPDGASHYATGIFVLPLLLTIARSMGNLVFRRARLADWLQVGFIIPLVIQTLRYPWALLNTDFPTFLVGLTLTVRFMDALEKPIILDDDVLLLAVISAIGVTFKLTFLVFAAGIAVVIALRYRPARRIAAVTAITLALLIGGTWIARNIVISGYPLFPSSALPMPVDWRVPKALTDETANWVYSWARIPRANFDQTLGTFSWLGAWYKDNRTNPDLVEPILLTLAGLLLFLAARRKAPARLSLYFAPHLLALLFWFLTAPDPRFARANLWGLSIGMFVIGISYWKLRSLFMVIAIAYYLNAPVQSLRSLKFDPFSGSPLLLRETAPTQTWLWVNLPPNSLTNNRCYRIPLPCTPYFRDNLELRQPGSLSGGFRLSEPYVPRATLTTP